jgi:hypothetical protein
MPSAMVWRRMFDQVRIQGMTRKRCNVMAFLTYRRLRAIEMSCLIHDMVPERAELDALEKATLST